MSKLNSICNICGKIHLKVCQHYNEGKSAKIALVLSYPNMDEEKKGMPVCGDTGKRLEDILEELRKKKYINVKNYTDRYDFRITNAYCAFNVVEWNDKLVTSMDNVLRLYEELEDTIKEKDGIIICFGKKAEKAVGKMCEVFVKKNIDKRIIKTNVPCIKNKNIRKITTKEIVKRITDEIYENKVHTPIKIS